VERPGIDEVREALTASAALRGLGAEVLGRLVAEAEIVVLRAGEELFAVGDPADAFYVVRAGTVEIVRRDTVLTTLGRGALFGELSLLTGRARTAAVRARRDSEVVRVPAAALETILSDPAGVRVLVTALATRLGEVEPLPPPSVARSSVIAVVASGGTAAAAAFADALAAAMRKIGATVTVCGAGVPAELEAAEAAHDHVLLVAGAVGDVGAAAALRQSDRVVVVADAAEDQPPPPPAVAPPGPVDVVLCGRAVARHTRRRWTDRWAPRAVLAHPHGAPDPEALAPLARRLTGRSVGVVLSGGGARALAHIGVLGVLEEAGVTVDRIGGCSMGAFLAALSARGHGPRELHEIARREFVARSPLGDYRLPRRSVLTGRRAAAMIARAFGDDAFEDLDVPCFSVAVDLNARALVVHRRGPIARAVGASMCLPGLFEPQQDGDRLLVDGGVLDNLPIATMAADGEGPVLAVDVTAPHGGGVAGRAGSLKETIVRAITIASADTADAAARHAELVVRPEVGGVGLLEFDRLDDLVAAGATAARAALRGWDPAGA
jgi:NTE family protein